jgi:hypothetical protein
VDSHSEDPGFDPKSDLCADYFCLQPEATTYAKGKTVVQSPHYHLHPMLEILHNHCMNFTDTYHSCRNSFDFVCVHVRVHMCVDFFFKLYISESRLRNNCMSSDLDGMVARTTHIQTD